MKVSLEMLLHPVSILPEVTLLWDSNLWPFQPHIEWTRRLDSGHSPTGWWHCSATNGLVEIVIKLFPHLVQTNGKMGPFPHANTISIHPQARFVATGPSVKWLTVPFFPTLSEFTDILHGEGACVDRVVANSVSQWVKARNELMEFSFIQHACFFCFDNPIQFGCCLLTQRIYPNHLITLRITHLRVVWVRCCHSCYMYCTYWLLRSCSYSYPTSLLSKTSDFPRISYEFYFQCSITSSCPNIVKIHSLGLPLIPCNKTDESPSVDLIFDLRTDRSSNGTTWVPRTQVFSYSYMDDGGKPIY